MTNPTQTDEQQAEKRRQAERAYALLAEIIRDDQALDREEGQ